jgi:hypothetical protein
MERCAIFAAYLILTGLLGFMSVDSIAVINSRLHIGDPVSYLKGKTSIKHQHRRPAVNTLTIDPRPIEVTVIERSTALNYGVVYYKR